MDIGQRRPGVDDSSLRYRPEQRRHPSRGRSIPGDAIQHDIDDEPEPVLLAERGDLRRGLIRRSLHFQDGIARFMIRRQEHAAFRMRREERRYADMAKSHLPDSPKRLRPVAEIAKGARGNIVDFQGAAGAGRIRGHEL